MHMRIDAVAGLDEKDSSTFQIPHHPCSNDLEEIALSNSLTGKKIGVPKVLRYICNNCTEVCIVVTGIFK